VRQMRWLDQKVDLLDREKRFARVQPLFDLYVSLDAPAPRGGVPAKNFDYTASLRGRRKDRKVWTSIVT
jgi:hypothetical protein